MVVVGAVVIVIVDGYSRELSHSFIQEKAYSPPVPLEILISYVIYL